MRAAVLAALAACAAGVTASPATVHAMSDHGLVDSAYTTPQVWAISCTPYSTLLVNIISVPSGFNLTAGQSALSAGHGQRVSCPSSGNASLLFTPHDASSHLVVINWTPVTLAPNTATVYYKPNHGSVYSSYSAPEEWIISCTPGYVLTMDVAYTPSGYSLTADGAWLASGVDQRVPCPSSGRVSLLYTPYDGSSHYVRFTWARSLATPAPPTPVPVPLHSMPDHGSVHKNYSTPQQWVISCPRGGTYSLDIPYTPSGYTLELSGSPLHSGYDRRVVCSSGELWVLYTPEDGGSHLVGFTWSPVTPTPSTTEVNIVSDRGSVSGSYSTPVEWFVTCTPDSVLAIDVLLTPSEYSLKVDGAPLSYGSDQQAPCPPSGKALLLFTPYTEGSHAVRLAWSPATLAPSTTVHHRSGTGSVDRTYSTPHEWIISCTPNSTVYVIVMQLQGTLMTGTTSLSRGETAVACRSSGNAKLLYIPPPGSTQAPLSMRWSPEPEGNGSEGISALLIVLIAAAGVLALAGGVVAVGCLWHWRATDSKAHDRSNVQCYAGYTGEFGVLQDSCSSPQGQTGSDMDQQLLPLDGTQV